MSTSSVNALILCQIQYNPIAKKNSYRNKEIKERGEKEKSYVLFDMLIFLLRLEAHVLDWIFSLNGFSKCG